MRVRRRRRQPGHVRRDAQPRRAVEAAGGLHGHQQPVRHGHGDRAPLRAVTDLHRRGDGFGVPGMRCDGMDVVDDLRRDARGDPARARGPAADPRRGRHLPLPRALDGRPRGVPHQGAGRGVAQARPDQHVRRAAAERGRGRAGRAEAARRGGGRAGRRGGRVRRQGRRSRRPSRSTTTSTCSATRCRAGTRSTSARPACTAARTSGRSPRRSAGRPTTTTRRSRRPAEEDVDE